MSAVLWPALAGAEDRVIVRDTDVLTASGPLLLFRDGDDPLVLTKRQFIGAEWSAREGGVSVGDPLGITEGYLNVRTSGGRLGVELGAELGGQLFEVEVKPRFTITVPEFVAPGERVRIKTRANVREPVRHAIERGGLTATLDAVGHGRVEVSFGGRVGSTSYDVDYFDVFNAGTTPAGGLNVSLLSVGPGNTQSFPIPPSFAITLRSPPGAEFEVPLGSTTNSGPARSIGQALTGPVISFDTSLTSLFATVAGLSWGWGAGASLTPFGVSFEPLPGTGASFTLADLTMQQGFLLRQRTQFTFTEADFNWEPVSTSAGSVNITDVLGNNLFDTTNEFEFEVPAGVMPGEVLEINYSISVLGDLLTQTYLTTGLALSYTLFGATLTLGGFELFNEALFEGTVAGASGPGILLGDGLTILGGSDFGILQGSFTVTVIPEPTAGLMVLALSAGALLARRGRR
ncbi:MAG: hypothetical protein ACK4PI_11955 [Tepidisphaerales bacterium]